VITESTHKVMTLYGWQNRSPGWQRGSVVWHHLLAGELSM